MTSHERRLRDLTWVLIAAQAVMLGLQWIGRAAPSRPPVHAWWPAPMADDWWWVGCHAVAVALLCWGLARHRRWLPGVIGSWLSAAAWLIWGTSDLAWSIDTRPPVSLVAPLLALAVCVPLSVIVAPMWSDRGLTD